MLSPERLLPADLPEDWNRFSHSFQTQELGEAFLLSGKNAWFQVPSAVVQGDTHILLNLQHPGFSRIRIVSVEKFSSDLRFFKG